MSAHPPIVRRYTPPSDAEAAESRAAAQRIRDEIAAKREAARPARRAAILTGPPLRDLDAAVDCHCGCHPRAADTDLHDGGTTCSCQLTEDERVEAKRSFLSLLSELGEESSGPDSPWARQREAFRTEAERFGVDARIEASGAPFVIAGVCDGRGFSLRERHGSYRVTIAPDDDPISDPWRADVTEDSIDVAGGDEAEFDEDGAFSAARALRIAVTSVRTALARNRCAHERAEGDAFCPECGVPMADADAWRWSAGLGGR